MESTNTTSKVASSTFWIFFRVLFTLILNLVVIGILSRQLDPNEFGLVALAGVLIQFLTFISSQGINEYIIYDPVEHEREERINAAFWLDIILGLITFAICIALIPAFVRFYQYEQLALIALLMAIKFPFDAISRVPDALFKKELNFKGIELRDSAIQFTVALGGIVMALNGFGVWSLVVPSLLASPIRAIIIFRLSTWRPKLDLGISYWKEIFKYSRNIIGSTLTSFIISQGDTLLIGKLLGPTFLGIYNIAWRSANLVNRSLLQVSNKITLPTLAKSAGDIAKLSSSFKKIIRILGVVAFPPLVGLIVVADVFILVIYGEKWVDAILPLRILLIYAMRFSVSTPVGAVFKAIGKPQIGFKIGLFIIPFYLTGIYLGSEYGIVGVATGVTIVRTFSGFLSFYWVGKVLNESYIAVSRPLLQPFLLSIFLAGILILVRLVLCFIGLDQPLAVLVISMLIGVLASWLLLRNIFRSLSLEIMGYLTHIMPTKVSMILLKLLNQN